MNSYEEANAEDYEDRPSGSRVRAAAQTVKANPRRVGVLGMAVVAACIAISCCCALLLLGVFAVAGWWVATTYILVDNVNTPRIALRVAAHGADGFAAFFSGLVGALCDFVYEMLAVIADVFVVLWKVGPTALFANLFPPTQSIFNEL